MRVIICLLVSLTCFSQENKNEWLLSKSENGISIYSRQINGSALKELKAVVSVKTSLCGVVALLSDWDAYPEWVCRCGKSCALKKISDTEIIHYQTVTIPWPAESQDLVIDTKFSQDEKTQVVTIKSINNPYFIPPAPSHIRVPEYNSVWILTPLKDGTVQIMNQLHVISSGFAAWMVNIAAIEGMYETMLNLKYWVQKEKYQKAKSIFIKD